MILHLKSPNVFCINQQSDLLMYSSGLFQAHCITYQNGRDAPCDFSTIKYTKKQVVFRNASSFAPKWSDFFYLFPRTDALLQFCLFVCVGVTNKQTKRDRIFHLLEDDVGRKWIKIDKSRSVLWVLWSNVSTVKRKHDKMQLQNG